MYKSKLQELCQKKAWDLPVYETSREGEDHIPRFQASVTVNGVSFRSQSIAKNSKVAQNDAAKVAFDHFSAASVAPPRPPPPVITVSASPSSANVEPERNSSSGQQLQVQVQKSNQTPWQGGLAEKFEDMSHLCKHQLQIFAQKRNMALPVYYSERVGPCHASRFKCGVTVGGQTFESQEFFTTLSKAESAAAKVALMSLSPDGVEENESSYKNLLQELAQKKGFQLPSYSTERSGEPHLPVFLSTVEIEGQVFVGQEAKSKKQAEISAAKAAYMAMKQRNSSQSSISISRADQGQEAPQSSASSLRSNVTTFLQQNIQPKFSVPNEEAEEERGPESCPPIKKDSPSSAMPISSVPEHVLPTSPALASNEAICLHPPITFTRPESCAPVNKDSPSCAMPISSVSEHVLPTSPALAASFSNLSVSNSNPSVATNTKGQSKVVRVYSREISITNPPGSIVLPMSTDKWVAVEIPPQLSN